MPGAAPGPGRPAAPTPAARGHHHGRPAARLGALIALALLPLLVGGVALGRSAGLLALPSGEPAGAEATGGQDLLRLRATAHPAPGTPPPSGEIAPAVAAAPTATPLPSPTAAPTTAPAAPTLAPVAEPPAVPATAPTVPAEATAPTVPAALPPTSVPRAVSTPAPASAPPVQPTAAPAAPASPTRPPPAEGAAPAQAVAAFYQSLVQRRFDQAVALWTPRMQANFPPAENIYSRFAPTQQLTLRRAEVVALDEAAGRATVAIDLIEVYGSPPATRRYVGTWQVVRGPTGWLLDQPSLARG